MTRKTEPIQLTPKAHEHLLEKLQEKDAVGIILRLRTRGCSGLSYVMEYVNDNNHSMYINNKEYTTITLFHPYTLFIHRAALLFLVGTKMDYHNTPTRSGFVFENPNEKGRCGCGSSFHV